MSRIGNKPIKVPQGVTVALNDNTVSVKGPKGELKVTLVDQVEVSIADGAVTVTPRNGDQTARAMWGMQRTLINNLITGVTKGYTEELEINGVGYRAAIKGKDLQLQLGYSHDVMFPIPAGIQIACPEQTKIVITGINKQQVGQVAANIRQYRKPEPYKGKGVKYVSETVFRKEGKKK